MNANDHTLACVRVLYRFYNRAGNALRHLLIANLSKNLGPEDPDCHSGIKLIESLDPLVIQLLASESQSIVTLQASKLYNDCRLELLVCAEIMTRKAKICLTSPTIRRICHCIQMF